ncbi:MAG: Ig-like domain-containing protein [Clostridia bacterium]|nr:Ig-like domain-containing protein [Clostridia bacterium]
MRSKATLLIMLVLSLLLLSASAMADADTDAEFTARLEALLTPAQEGMATGTYAIHTGDTAYVPDVAPAITPYDKRDTTVYPPVNGTFSTSDEAVVTVSGKGEMTGIAEGTATVTYHADDGDHVYEITVSDEALPELVKNYVYTLRQQFYTVKRARLPKYNRYAKWYYGRKNEVGWCGVFTIWCANAAGTNPLKVKQLDTANPPMVQYMREGNVSNQYEGYKALDRWTGIPKPGYTIIYANLENNYKYIHIGSVADVVDRGNGIYQVTTIEGNVSNSIKSYCFLYDSNASNHMAAEVKGQKLQRNMSTLPKEEQTDPLVQYKLITDTWAVFGFGQSWE